MKREELLIRCLDRIQDEDPEEGLARYPQLRDELEPLLRTSLQLSMLPEDIALCSLSKARVRGQLMVEARTPRPVPQPSLRERLAALLAPPQLTLARQTAMALSMFVALGVAGAGTVSAAMESLPGDGLYPIKTAAEQARVALAFTPAYKADAYLSIAAARLDELSRLTEEQRLDLVPQVLEQYATSVGEAVRLSAETPVAEPQVQVQLAALQSNLQDIYGKAPQDIQTRITQTIAITANAAGTLPSDRSPAARNVTSPAPTAAASPGAALITTATTIVDPLMSTGLPTGKTSETDTAPTDTPKEDPVSRPLAQPSPTAPASNKGNIGPAPGPVPGKEDSSSIAPAGSEPVKTDPLAPAVSATEPAKTDPAAPAVAPTEPAKTEPVASTPPPVPALTSPAGEPTKTDPISGGTSSGNTGNKGSVQQSGDPKGTKDSEQPQGLGTPPLNSSPTPTAAPRAPFDAAQSGTATTPGSVPSPTGGK